MGSRQADLSEYVRACKPNSRFSRSAPRFPGTWCSKPSLFFQNHSLCPSQVSWVWEPPGSLGWALGLWASGSPFTCNLTFSHLCRCFYHPCRQVRWFFFFNEKFFKFYSALQFFKSFAHVISYNPITTPPLFPYPYLAPPRIPLPSGNHWFVLCIF